MSYVRRPSSKSNGAPNSPPIASSITSSPYGASHPPCANPPDRSSSGPPGACITPSSETNAAPMILRGITLTLQRRFDRGDVDLFHRHHRVERALGRGLVGV